MDGWVDGWMDGWMSGRAGLRLLTAMQSKIPLFEICVFNEKMN